MTAPIQMTQETSHNSPRWVPRPLVYRRISQRAKETDERKQTRGREMREDRSGRGAILQTRTRTKRQRKPTHRHLGRWRTGSRSSSVITPRLEGQRRV